MANPDSKSNPQLSPHTRHAEKLRPEVPDHEILRLIGRGAYGEVWLARSVTGAYRAVKVVWREDYDDEKTYVREFEGILHYEPVARGIPGVVHILHVGQDSGDHPCYYYVMELADDAYTGVHIDVQNYVPRTLQSDMDLYGHNPMPLDYVLEIGSQLAHALDGMHSEELSHCDIKPSNIVFVHGRAKLADAGSVAPNSGHNFAGTQGYIPPDGSGTPRADVYALAKVLYEMSTGKDRMEFPELPSNVPEGASHRRWIEFNKIICAAAEPLVSKKGIVSAQVLAERIDELRQYAPRHHAIMKRRKHWAGCIGAAVGLLTLGVICGYTFLPRHVWHKLDELRTSLTSLHRTPPSTGTQLFITTVPAGASIYTKEGVYVDETPYGPVDTPPEQEVSFILRKEGYSDLSVNGVTPKHGVLALGGDLQPFRPPKKHEDWQDVLGSVYRPSNSEHRALEPVTVAQFETFLRRSASLGPVRYEKSEKGPYVRTTRESINAYTLWLARMCEARGSLGRDHTLVALPEPNSEAENDICEFRLVVRPVQKTPITINTTPPGATVWLNGHPLSVTPLQGVRIPLAPYFLEIKMPGFATERFSGISPKDLVINVALKLNNSVAFGTSWVNSLGLRFLPLSPTLMAGVTEVRVSDYRAFAATTGANIPPLTDFVQGPDHPAVGISRADAERFARWLTMQERETGLIESTDEYRLPTDEEWSAMMGSKDEHGTTPYDRARSRYSTPPRHDFAWGPQWPPPPGTGNFADSSALPYVSPQYVIEHYSDNFPFTAPVASFAPNILGFYDMTGNVQEWVSDEYGGPPGFAFRHYAVTRGGDYSSFRPSQLSSGIRTPRPADDHSPTVGFRLMLERNNKRL